MDGQTDGQADGQQMERWVDGWIDGLTEKSDGGSQFDKDVFGGYVQVLKFCHIHLNVF